MDGKWKAGQAGRLGAVQYTTIKVRLYPTEAQAELFEKTFGCCRYIWNRMLADQQRFYIETGAHFIPTPAKYKREAPFLKEVDNQALIQEHGKLAQAFRVFFKNPECFGYPKFKRKKDDKDSFTACNHEFASGPTIYVTRKGIRMTKAGIVRARFHRRPQGGWKLKRVTVQKGRSGNYYGCILYERLVKKPEAVVPRAERTVGLKQCASHFYVTDHGATADLPAWIRRDQEKLAKLQGRLSRMERGSENYKETLQKCRVLHEHIANQRRDFVHKESRRIANAWDAVCIRDDGWKGPAGKPAYRNGKEPGFGMFQAFLRYKLEREGKVLIVVGRYAPTTRTCSVCGWEQEAERLQEKRWTCPECGAVHDRARNAAKNIKALGLAQYFNAEGRRGGV